MLLEPFLFLKAVRFGCQSFEFWGGRRRNKKSGDVLLSQGVSTSVPSALVGLTAVFGMGTGVTPPLWSPKNFEGA